ncbi:rab-GTPase-TBC domain-containing protein [Mycotypha africana]|uniref:rab-GTPase-TBC domain-containing protein n=1 Tax=Mycotypha africana TaxID=64632 RepID=UPI0023011D5A|nr:rab-GTPase-TBC domain-containing protein [Mycotypha africana]KAI8967381.1 rab-GTPase-TBC domain-containing protein [Mycotypha africana]
MNQQDEEDLSYLNDFQEILQSEVYVDLERLRILARHGIPESIRGEVWKYLLGVQQADRSKELSSSKARNEEYDQLDKMDNDLAKRIRGELSRYQRRVPEFQGQDYTQSFVNIITAYLNANRDVEYNPNLIALCAPFIYVSETECDAYSCFERLMQAMDEYNSNISLKEQVAQFMTLFRYGLPELCSYFDEEEVDLNEWSTSWLQNLLSKEMRFENLVRLWDTYFAMTDFFAFHPFVCLSILLSAKEALEDLEQSEIRTMLLRLPLLNMEMIIADAYNFRHETIERQMNENGEL